MRISLITLFPEVLGLVQEIGVIGRAVQTGLCSVEAINVRDFALNEYGMVDDRPYGGGPGMVMRVEPLVAAIRAAKDRFRLQVERDGSQTDQGNKPLVVKTIAMSPQGRPLDTQMLTELLALDHLVLVAGRYEGIDERVNALEVDEEVSIGDYVLTGGELPALVLMDALVRRLPGVLGNQASLAEDSFEEGELDHPHYSRPPVFEGLSVPDVLMSGNHQAIAAWRANQRKERTQSRRPDLLRFNS